MKSAIASSLNPSPFAPIPSAVYMEKGTADPNCFYLLGVYQGLPFTTPYLGKTKLIEEPFDSGPFSKRWSREDGCYVFKADEVSRGLVDIFVNMLISSGVRHVVVDDDPAETTVWINKT